MLAENMQEEIEVREHTITSLECLVKVY